MSKTILYVDDEEDMRLVVSACLEGDGYRVLTAPNVAAGIELALKERPDLIITDVMMPGESGYSLCSRIRRDPDLRDTPVVVVTVLEDEGEARRVGASAFLSKPFEDEELRRTVGDLLRRDADRRETS